ncbi:GerAB/ArcD/ProY family transporter [Alicyclobacillus ferrooxydans]|uniref:Spore gernimation protein n=1 Tax=Alicyclobacillus ferrooxydans TaxID=471514 RepID=A0A0P9EX53_9BACL|nr:endospore germination permease [Alicyclobacillus ferrooxydans]KPV43702.1 spore gernimation protein [Alicyclobacillus ferrooxydans]
MVRSITILEVVAILFGSMVGVGVLAAPRLAVEAGGTAGPLVSLMGVLVVFVGASVVAALGMRFPKESIISYAAHLIGKWPARLISICIVLYFATLTALAAREFGKVAVVTVLPKTPSEVTTFVMIALVAIASRNSMSTFAYIHLFYFPLIAAPIALISVLSLKNANLLYLQPLVGTGSLGSMTQGAFVIAALLQGGFVLTIVIPAMRRTQKAMKATWIGIALAAAVYLFTVIAALSVLGPREIASIYWPTLELAKTTMLPGEVLERLDAVFLSVWVIAVFTTTYSTYFLTLESVRQLTKLNDSRMLSLPFAVLVFFIAMLPPNIVQLYRVITVVGKYGLILTVGYPVILWLVAVFRRIRGVETTQ